ncbi:3-dehydroquinate synthase [Aequorivita marisscotiae]|uniref:3-dehydroquinate synthase n=1 Tax=Aequorivita marisscotiae TaxID=3040348 RepID=A0ABY8KWF9_9FLAO|nr:3-dehydroquinate synthase [Aequorivita sp. Ant34-E75]WGF92067.1 3-dehydroquinate synthase [Aequorivita sp. Ant34-E75]
MEINLPEKGQVYHDHQSWNAVSKYIDNQVDAKIFVLVDKNTATHCLPYFLKKYEGEKKIHTITIAVGEIHKNITTCLNVWNTLSNSGADRNSIIINLGGGVVTDLGGFVASTFKRGLRFINIPTTLLAMVDASVGGKNGVDLGHLKNQIGVITQPEMVILDTNFLQTLPKVHITSGLAEMLKHGLIYSEDYWERLKKITIDNKREFDELLIESVEIKNKIVTEDPFEKNLRKTLNYGHTLGHAIESYLLKNKNKQPLLHGEAVAIGLILATYISAESIGFPKEKLDDVATTILAYFPKVDFTTNDIDEVIKLLVFDKKNSNGEVRFVLLENIGHPRTNCTVSNKLIFNAFNYYKNF